MSGASSTSGSFAVSNSITRCPARRRDSFARSVSARRYGVDAVGFADLRKVVIIERASDWAQQERPYEVNAALLAFLRSLDAAA